MRITQLRRADLNLLVVFTVLAEERSVSRAAIRLSLSQPAVTRALQRLRDMFRDDLIIRVSGNYELTPKGQRLLQELEITLPKLDRLLTGAAFDPGTEEAHFRLAGTDYATHVVCPPLCQRFLSAGKGISFSISPLNDDIFDAMERGRIDLLLHADDGHVPLQYPREVIFEEEFVCVVARKFPCSGQLTLKQYLNASHIGVTILGGKQTIPEQRLTAARVTRHCPFSVPYFSMAIRSVAGTPLIATVPKRLARAEARGRGLKILKAPKIMGHFKYLMTWHPRMNSDAAHLWLRSTIQAVGEAVAEP
ncbi:MAG TPA: LysR family transcriptional regulator [Candidatus Methylacidiphilales bacterium]